MAIGDLWSDLWSDLWPGSLIPTHTVPVPQPKKKEGLPEITWQIDGHEVPALDDWRATTVVNGGFDSARVTVPASFDRHFSSFDVGASLRASQPDGMVIWEGDVVNAPTPENGLIEIVAAGGSQAAAQRDEDLLYQDRELAWQDEAGAPHNATPAESISVSATDGMLKYESPTGTEVAMSDKHGLARWVSGCKIRRVRGTLTVTGDTTNYEMVLEKATGPIGGRTEVSTFAITTGTFDVTIVSPTDMVVLSVRRVGATHTRSDDLAVLIRDIRINDLTLADSFDLSNIIADIGMRLGFDTSGLSVGIPVGNLSPAIQRWRELPIFTTVRIPGRAGRPATSLTKQTGVREVMISETPAVLGSPMNFLPFFWQGPWAEAIDYLCGVIDWRWRVLGNVTGRGRVLDAGPWGPSWSMSQGSAQVSLTRSPPFNRQVVRWITTSGVPQQTVVTPEVDPFELRRITRAAPVETIVDPQPSDSIPRAVASSLMEARQRGSIAGRIDITGLADTARSPYGVLAGDLVDLGWWGEGASELRVSQTEMSAQGVALGINQEVSIVNLLAFLAQRKARQPFGVIRLGGHVGGGLRTNAGRPEDWHPWKPPKTERSRAKAGQHRSPS